MTTKPMMECGHAANATSKGDPVCAICVGLHPGARVIAEAQPDLTGRTAKCSYRCGSTAPSSTSLAFFTHQPNQEHDNYYCGCWGWD